MRIVLMGTGPFAIPAFRALVGSSHEVTALVTRPPRGLHRKQPSSPARELAAEHQLAVFDPESINAPASLDWLRSQRADLLVVCDYGQILSADALATSSLGGINLHGSLLPKYRGAAPINWAIWEGETETGVSIIHMTPRLDAGPVLVQRRTHIHEQEDAVALEARLAELGAEATLEGVAMLDRWDRRSPLGTPQAKEQATRAPRLKKTQGQIDWSEPSERIARQVRALQPWPGTFTRWLRQQRPMRLLITRAESVDLTPDHQPLSPGELVAVDRQSATVACGRGGLRLLEVQPEGKKRMPMGDFLRGHPMRPGDRLGP